MPIINTSEDLLRLLDENAEFREAARRHILTDELIRSDTVTAATFPVESAARFAVKVVPTLAPSV